MGGGGGDGVRLRTVESVVFLTLPEEADGVLVAVVEVGSIVDKHTHSRNNTQRFNLTLDSKC